MNEYQIGYAAVGGIVGLALTCLLWMLGGRKGKWKRRYVGAAIISSTCLSLAGLLSKFQPLMIGLYATTMMGFSMGYGGDSIKEKLTRRSIFVAGNLGSGVLLSLALNNWSILPIHAGVALWTIYLGVRNPIHAAAEEVFVCLILNLGLLIYPFVL